MSKDWDGDPISSNHNRSGLKSRPKRSTHMHNQRRKTPTEQ